MPVPDHELLVQLLTRVPDPRRRRGVRHPVGALIAVAVCAVVAGARGFTAIGEWARDAGGAALERLGLERGGVDESTLRRLFARLDADRLDAVLGAWALARTVLVAGRRVIAIDGKTVRGARGGDSAAPHLVAALAHGSGAVLGQASTLRDYGIHSVGLLAAVPPATVQRLLGGRAGRTAADRARGIDPRPVVPRTLPAAATVRHTFLGHTLDGAAARAALLGLVVRLGLLLRRRDQAARALTITLTFAGNSSWTKTRRLAEPSPHDDDLRTLAYQLMDAVGLQRGRLTALALKCEDLIGADQVAQQISLDDAREDRLVAEAAVDRVRDKFGPRIIGPAAVFRRASPGLSTMTSH
uniref:Transposase family protein n=1 Tax=Streptomyces sp. NBC_00180 TaxID=2903632 RepID=A0AAU1ICF0_9ACTN